MKAAAVLTASWGTAGEPLDRGGVWAAQCPQTLEAHTVIEEVAAATTRLRPGSVSCCASAPVCRPRTTLQQSAYPLQPPHSLTPPPQWVIDLDS